MTKINKVEQLSEIIKNAKNKNICFFGGAGVSTESGIPDFRSVDGLYNQEYDFPPETIISHSFFMKNPKEFYRFYFNKMVLGDDIKPNPAHLKLAQWENEGKLSAVITQNIDGLHQIAGSKNVFELHGTIHNNYCMTCHEYYNLEQLKQMRDEDGIPRCTKHGCKGIIKPDVVLYEEPLDNNIMNGAIKAISQADTLIIAGTSLIVQPAASLVNFFRGTNLVIINREPTPRDNIADLCISGNVGEILDSIDC